jgi:hypothetical protein
VAIFALVSVYTENAVFKALVWFLNFSIAVRTFCHAYPSAESLENILNVIAQKLVRRNVRFPVFGKKRKGG